MMRVRDRTGRSDEPVQSSDALAAVRICGNSYVVSVTKQCRDLGVVDGEYVKVTLERTGMATGRKGREVSPCVRAYKEANGDADKRL